MKLRPLARLKNWLASGPFNGAQEGAVRGPFYGMGELGNLFRIEQFGDGWQRHLNVGNGTGIAAVQAAVAAYCNAFTLMPATHKRQLPGGGFEEVTTSALSRWLYRPNGFQTMADFMANGIRVLMEKGNAVAFAARNDRQEIVATVWATSFSTHIDPETGALFYAGSLNDGVTRPDFLVPARDVLHIRINAPISRPLQGVSPLVFCASSLCVNAQLSAFLNAYIANRASPSYVLSTDLVLNVDQTRQLRAAWDEQSKTLASGGTPITSGGLRPFPRGVAPGDELLVQTFNLTIEDIARAFSMPRALLGISETAANAEQLLRSWVSLGLGSLVETVEQQIEKFFDLSRTDHVEFDSNALLRLDAEAQMRVLGEGVTKGILAADEARADLGRAPIPGGFGKIPTVQQQQIPLDLLHELHVADIAAKTKPEPAPVVEEEPVEEEEEEVDPEVTKALVIAMFDKKRRRSA
jgi:HK97 family phage portal protein